MWELDNATEYAVGRNWIRDKNGVHSWLVAVKATFDILPSGYLSIAEQQPEPLLEPQYRGDPATTSLRLDSDLLAAKPTTDIVLDAIAFAPGGRPTSRVDVQLRIDNIVKSLVVFGPRVYYAGLGGNLALSRPEAFITQTIHYEYAFGGSALQDPDPAKRRMDDRNPVGRGVAADKRDLYDRPAHVIEYAGDSTQGPAGFGPIASFWAPRRQRAGTYDRRWENSKKPLLPDDYDPLFGMSAPDDQRPSQALRGGESVLITNMTTDGALRFELPTITPSFETVFPFRTVRHEGRLTTVFIVPHQRTVSLVWQSVLAVPALDTDYLDFTLIGEE